MEAEQSRYQSEFGGDVVMGCRFRAGLPASDLKVTWHWISPSSTREAYRLDNGAEHPATQDPVYRGRAALLREQLEDGWARLKVPGPGSGGPEVRLETPTHGRSAPPPTRSPGSGSETPGPTSVWSRRAWRPTTRRSTCRSQVSSGPVGGAPPPLPRSLLLCFHE